jgi:hypothetical protein
MPSAVWRGNRCDADDTFLARWQHSQDTMDSFNADLSCEQVQTCSSF